VGNTTSGNASVTTGQDNFMNGVANPVIGFNFNRSLPENPFMVTSKNFNIANIHDNDTNTTQLAPTPVATAAYFYYGRVHSKDYYTNANNITAKDINYEVYISRDHDSDYLYTSYLLKDKLDIDYRDWYINLYHRAANDGNVTLFDKGNSSVELNKGGTTTIASGQESLDIKNTAGYTPYTAYIQMLSPSWLNHESGFTVQFRGTGGSWAGHGQVNSTAPVGRVIGDGASNGTIKSKMDW
jgi:hypothetical protein